MSGQANKLLDTKNMFPFTCQLFCSSTIRNNYAERDKVHFGCSDRNNTDAGCQSLRIHHLQSVKL